MPIENVDKPVQGSHAVHGVAELTDINSNPVPEPLVVMTQYGHPYRLAVELVDRALRDLGIVDIGNQVPIGHGTDAIYNGTTALTPQFAAISAASSGATEVVAAVASKKIRVLQYNFMSNGTVDVKFQSASTDKTGLYYTVANTGLSAPFSPIGYFETAAGEALNVNLSGNIAIGGVLAYVEV